MSILVRAVPRGRPGAGPDPPGHGRRETTTVVFGVWVERRGVPFAGSPQPCVAPYRSPSSSDGGGFFRAWVRGGRGGSTPQTFPPSSPAGPITPTLPT